MNSEKYWARRADARERALHKKSQETLKKNWPGTMPGRWLKSRKISRPFTDGSLLTII